MNDKRDLQERTIDSFGEEWWHFDQGALSIDELRDSFLQYFNIFPDSAMQLNARGVDRGCGSGWWARFVAPQVQDLLCVDACLAALSVARSNFADQSDCHFFNADVGPSGAQSSIWPLIREQRRKDDHGNNASLLDIGLKHGASAGSPWFRRATAG